MSKQKSKTKPKPRPRPDAQPVPTAPISASPLLGLAVLLTGLAMLLTRTFTPDGQNLSFRYAGFFSLGLGALFLALAFGALVRGGKLAGNWLWGDARTLVQSGIFRIVRHPQYLGWMLAFSGLAMLSQAWYISLMSAFGITGLHLLTLSEEAQCWERFGREYQEYMEKTPRYNFLVGLVRLIRQK